MPAPDFFDTNVLVYAYDPSDGRKQRIAQDLVRKALAGEIVTSTQVLAEFAATLLHKMSPPAHPADLIAVLEALGPGSGAPYTSSFRMLTSSDARLRRVPPTAYTSTMR